MIEYSLRKLEPSSFNHRSAKHLLNRAGFGGTEEQVAAITKLGLIKAVDYIVEYEGSSELDPSIENTFDKDIIRPATETERDVIRKAREVNDKTVLDVLRKERQRRQRADRKQIAEMEEWWLRRLIETPRPLEEKMTLFWHGHFATGYRTIENSYHMYLQNTLFRDNALGNFKEDLVRGIIHDPAMIKYLNNDRNRKQAPNENLARELMELFTLGEGEGYTEKDIKEGAKALTGYNIDDDTFAFRARQHDTNKKSIFGRKGEFDGDDFVDLIFTKQSSSSHIVWKLYRFFVNDLPNGPSKEAKAYVKRLSSLLRRSKWEIKPVIKAMLLSAHFYDETNVNAIIKSPIQLVVQAVRSFNPPQRKKMLRTLSIATKIMGQQLFAPPSVKGWDGGRTWINTSTMFMRQNTMLYLLTGQRPDEHAWDAENSPFHALPLIESHRDSPEDVVLHLLSSHLGVNQPHPDRVTSLLDYMKSRGNKIDNQTVIGVLTLITTMPEYQLC